MGSLSNPNSWAPDPVYKDCSREICSIYCPQWCYIIFSPPPPSFCFGENSDDDDPSGFRFSPLIVAIIGILASTFILVTYYTIISRCCRNRNQVRDPNSQTDGGDAVMNQEMAPQGSSSAPGLDESIIRSITICKYKKGSVLVDGVDCSVCLSEFQENENLRLLPKCNHAFHLPCIDTWLKSHSSCPLCRSNINSTIATSFPNQIDHVHASLPEAPTSSINISALEHQHRNNDVVVSMIQSSERSSQHEIVINFGDEVLPKSQSNSCTSQSSRVSIAGEFNEREDDLELQREVPDLSVGSSTATGGELSEENGKSGE